jgi:sensor histidine kinase regulating citrate/malate metabolism
LPTVSGREFLLQSVSPWLLWFNDGRWLCGSHLHDNGLGIDLQRHGSRLFGLYNRFHFHTESKGLGLHAVKIQVEALKGKIEVQSKEGEGSVFKVLLPVR